MGKKRVCIICGKEFARDGKRLTCSPKCAREAKRRYSKKYLQEKRGAEELKVVKCPICGKEFKQIRGNQIVCSSECRKKRTRQLAKENKKTEKKKRTKTVRKSLIEIEKEAKEAGMSYGKYVALMEKKKSC